MKTKQMQLLAICVGLFLRCPDSKADEVRWIGETGGQWHDTINWSSHPQLPRADDDVTIDIPDDQFVNHTIGSHQIKSLRNHDSLSIYGGSLSILGDLQLFPGSSLEIGGDAGFDVAGSVVAVSSRLSANSGALLRLNSLTQYTLQGNNARFAASSFGSRLEAPFLEIINVHDADLEIQAVLGGRINLSRLTTVNNPNYYEVAVRSNGENSVVDLSALAKYGNGSINNITVERGGGLIWNPSDINGLRLEVGFDSRVEAPSVMSSRGNNLFALEGGQIHFPALNQFTADGREFLALSAIGGGSLINLDSVASLVAREQLSIYAVQGGRIDLAKLSLVTTADNGRISINADGVGSTIDMASLSSFSAGSISDLNVSNGGSVVWKSPTNISGMSLSVGKNSRIDTSRVTTADDTGLFASDGGLLALPELLEINSQEYTVIVASGEGGRIELPNLLSAKANNFTSLNAVGGGYVDAPTLAEIGTGQQRVFIQTQGQTSRISLTSLRKIKNGTIAPENSSQIILSTEGTKLEDIDVRLLDGGQITGAIDLENGSIIQGNGTILGKLDNRSGHIHPGFGSGAGELDTLHIAGELSQRQGAQMTLGARFLTTEIRTDHLRATGIARLAGYLDIVHYPTSREPALGDAFSLISASEIDGIFDQVFGRMFNSEFVFAILYGESEVAARVSLVGDSNFDDRFDSSDLVAVFKAGKYEDGVPNNTMWIEGDWNGDADFDSGDLTLAFQLGHYAQQATSANVVPEVGIGSGILSFVMVLLAFRRR